MKTLAEVTTHEKLLVSVKEAAAMLGIGKTLAYEMMVDGRWGPSIIRLGDRRLLDVAELRAWATAGCPARSMWLAMKGGGR